MTALESSQHLFSSSQGRVHGFFFHFLPLLYLQVMENNRIGFPTSPSSSDVQNRVLQAAAKHESQPSGTEVQNPSPESVTPLNEKVDLSEA